MLLPNAENAIIAEDKLARYLLDVTHRRSHSKAKLLCSIGYDPKLCDRLEYDLRHQHLIADVVEQRATV